MLSSLLCLVAEAQVLPPSSIDADINNPRALERFEADERADALKATTATPIAGGDAARDISTAPEGAEKVTFVLKDISFSQSKVFSPRDLDTIIKPYVGKTISVADLFHIVAEINDAYRKRGYVTGQAVLGPQKIAGGLVRIDLAEGKIGRTLVTGNKRVGSQFVSDLIRVEPGAVPTIELIERRVSAINFNRNFQVTAGLRPGQEPLTTDLTIDVIGEPKPVTASVYVDNNGTESTGLYSLGGVVSLYSPLGYDEMLTVGGTTSFTETRDIQNFDVTSAFADASIPISQTNANLRFLYSHSNSAVLEGDFASLGINGRGDVLISTLTQPFYTDATRNFAVLAGHQYSSTRSTVGIVDTDTRAQRVFLGVSGQMVPWAQTYLEGKLQVIQSWVDVWGLGEREDETVTRLVGEAAVSRAFENGLSVQARFSGQYTPQKRLPTGELWYMGGASTLPAYKMSSIAGDTGFVVSNQIRYTNSAANGALSETLGLPIVIGAKVFVDVGGAFDDFRLNRDSNFYADYGLGLDFDIASHLKGDLVVAWPVDADSNPNLEVDNPRFLFKVASTF
ncbi:ShlB/FhaC/HecB family hemolysin secretion/activation protein [Aureimonas ureilytica]|uniref:ShlB/FhaC/HecB family hemolysin secretion/activation protein n=1 Tax=Aureimonas ureilytica TaxID=401562 RepID=UPI0019D47DCC|nr:POTRA domain-containing protein [Aureimonas ureilytica]